LNIDLGKSGDYLVTKVLQALKIAGLTFTISLIISLLSQFSLAIWISIMVLLLVVITGIIFDIIGTSVTAATEAPFHAMGADKIKGSKQAIFLIRNASQVANFCNDVVGDISGTVSGAMIVGITLQFLRRNIFLPENWVNAAAIALIAALNVGGKALGKSYAIDKANEIVFAVGRILSFFKVVNFELKRPKRKAKVNIRKVRKI
jgi:hypothetical protein